MEQSPFWEAKSFSASQEIPHILWNAKVHYSNNKSTPPVTILSQINPVYLPIPLLEAQSLYYLSINVWVFQVVFFPRVFTKILYASLISPTRASRTAHLILLDLITRNIFGE
jgi:hypothetical protein